MILCDPRYIAIAPEIHQQKGDVGVQQPCAIVHVILGGRIRVELLRGGPLRRGHKVVESHKLPAVNSILSEFARVGSVADTIDVRVVPMVVRGVCVVQVQSVGAAPGIDVAVGAVVMEHDDALCVSREGQNVRAK